MSPARFSTALHHAGSRSIIDIPVAGLLVKNVDETLRTAPGLSGSVNHKGPFGTISPRKPPLAPARLTGRGAQRVLGIPVEGDADPWFRSRPRTALLVAAGLFGAVTVTRLFANGTGEAVDILYALPVALLAMSFGRRGGLIGAAIGFALFAVVELANGTGDIDATGWISRAAGLFLLGALLGLATDQVVSGRLRSLAAADERRRLEERTKRQAEGLEISDSILQHLAVAKWMIEAGDHEGAIEVLTSTMATGERMVADLLPVKHTCSDEQTTRDRTHGT